MRSIYSRLHTRFGPRISSSERRGRIQSKIAGLQARFTAMDAPHILREARSASARPHVIIIGAGFAGLMAAYSPERSLQCHHLRSPHRLGGRVWSKTAGGRIIEAGGELHGYDHPLGWRWRGHSILASRSCPPIRASTRSTWRCRFISTERSSPNREQSRLRRDGGRLRQDEQEGDGHSRSIPAMACETCRASRQHAVVEMDRGSRLHPSHQDCDGATVFKRRRRADRQTELSGQPFRRRGRGDRWRAQRFFQQHGNVALRRKATRRWRRALPTR